MTTTEKETKTETVEKSDETVKVDSMANVVTDLLKTKDVLIEKQNSDIDELNKKIAELTKTVNQNPVDQGHEKVQAVKATDPDDVGTKADAENYVAPKPSEAQASIRAPAVKEPGKDDGGVSMENKADDPSDEKKDEKKEEKMEKTDDTYKDEKKEENKDEKKDEKKEMEKSTSIYKVVEPIRPIIKANSYEGVPTAYAMLKALTDGTFGKDADAALTRMELEIGKGTFGNGRPTGGIY